MLEVFGESEEKQLRRTLGTPVLLREVSEDSVPTELVRIKASEIASKKASAVILILGSVSYTHLDVYKRQVQGRELVEVERVLLVERHHAAARQHERVRAHGEAILQVVAHHEMCIRDRP